MPRNTKKHIRFSSYVAGLLNCVNLMDCNQPGSSVHGVFQARIVECIAISSPGSLPDPGIEPPSPKLTSWFFTPEPPGKTIKFSYYINIS